MDWTITDLGPSDAERLLPQQQDIQALHALHRPEVFRGDADAAELLAFLRDRLEAEGIAFLGAERADGRLLGHAMLEIQEVTRDALKRARRRGVMHQIVVAPEARRMGVGLALVLQRCLGRADAARRTGTGPLHDGRGYLEAAAGDCALPAPRLAPIRAA